MPKIPASERDAFYEARRSELAAVALELWAERGFDQTSVAAIAEEAGVSKGTFYLYFESKDALLEEVLRRNSLVPNIQGLIGDLQNQSLEEAVHGFVRGAWRHLCQHKDLVLVVLRELPTHLEQAQTLDGNALARRHVAPGSEAQIHFEAQDLLGLHVRERVPELGEELDDLIRAGHRHVVSQGLAQPNSNCRGYWHERQDDHVAHAGAYPQNGRSYRWPNLDRRCLYRRQAQCIG